MRKVFCDICEEEIVEEDYRVAVAKINYTIRAQWFDMCSKCKERIFDRKLREKKKEPAKTERIHEAAEKETAAPVEISIIDDRKKQPEKEPHSRKLVLDLAKISKLRREGWTIGRIAEEMGVSPGTIQRRLTS